MSKNIFNEIRQSICDEFSAEIDGVLMTINLIGAVSYEALFMNVSPKNSFVEVVLERTTILVPYENIISVEY